MSYDFQGQLNLWKRTLALPAYETFKKTFTGNITLIVSKCLAKWMGFDSKFKISLYHEYFRLAFQTRFPKFTLLFSISYVYIREDTICD